MLCIILLARARRDIQLQTSILTICAVLVTCYMKDIMFAFSWVSFWQLHMQAGIICPS